MTRTVEQTVASPIQEAQAGRQRDREDLARAREALVELVRQNQTASNRVIDDVAGKHGLPPATVQQALWSLLSEEALATDAEGKVTTGPRGLPD